MKILIKKFLRDPIIKVFGFFGYIILQKMHKDYAFNKVLIKLISNSHPIIFDIGAHNGASCERYNAIFRKPILHAFEPSPNQYKILEKKFKLEKNIYLNNVAVGSKFETKKFNQIGEGGRSSFLISTVDDISKQEKINVEVITVDEYVKKHEIKKINLLKIDTQGYENEVLKGAQETLKSNKIDIIETELILGNMYEKTLSFNEIENLIYPFGYKLFALTNANSNDQNSTNIISQPNLQFDIMYVSLEIYKQYAYGKHFFENTIYRKSSQTIENFMKDKLIRK